MGCIMLNKWAQTTIGEFCPFIYGKNLPDKVRKPGTIKVFGSNGAIGFHNYPFVSEPGIVIGRKGTIGAVHYSKEPFWPIDTTFYITSAAHRDLKFTYYLLQSLGLNRLNADSAVPGLSRAAAHSIRINIPSLAQQTKIANVLSILDTNIEINNRINAELEMIAKTLYDYW